jgi:hypothetical protein
MSKIFLHEFNVLLETKRERIWVVIRILQSNLNLKNRTTILTIKKLNSEMIIPRGRELKITRANNKHSINNFNIAAKKRALESFAGDFSVYMDARVALFCTLISARGSLP